MIKFVLLATFTSHASVIRRIQVLVSNIFVSIPKEKKALILDTNLEDYDFCNRVNLLKAQVLGSHKLRFAFCLFHEFCELAQIT